MADTYRPLRDDDPVGTEVEIEGCGPSLWVLRARHNSWGMLTSVQFQEDHPIVRSLIALRVRVPDPWGELLAAARIAYEVADFSNYPVTEQQLGDAIAAVEAAKKGTP